MALHGRAVIGAGFGDEGKGLVTDAQSARAGADCLVVRYNGGAQAGHTVVTPAGQRHVFSHFGSGSFNGSASYLSRYFLCNPILFLKEAGLLAQAGLRPRVLVDPAALVTTPYDMMINQAVEDVRGGARHGSCGLGIGETVERSLDPALRITVADLATGQLRQRLDRIRRDYVPSRLQRLGLPPDRLDALLREDAIPERFADDAAAFLDAVELAGVEALRRAGDLVFEGAQGLLLDQDRGFFPYVTRSNTGLHTVLRLADEAGLRSLDVSYVSRCYLTRHGAGPMPQEIAGLPYPAVEDRTNIPNPYQGALRLGWLDTDLLAASVAADLRDALAFPGLRVRAGLAVTCMDQCGDSVRCVSSGQLVELVPQRFLQGLAMATGAQWLQASYGPSRGHLRDIALESRVFAVPESCA